ncbi:MAG TPA: ABC transporter permease, partial [Vicinamibacterales bacterium]|nr:ABC transporter permease [Vicinamibacterales bacterium]
TGSSGLEPYLLFVRMHARLTMRDRPVLVLTLVVPLVFLTAMTRIGVPPIAAGAMALSVGILTNGVFGAGVRIAQDRDMGVLRRFRASPATAAHIVVGVTLGGAAFVVPSFMAATFLALAAFGFGLPAQPTAFVLFLTAAVLCSRSIGVLTAAITGSIQQSQLLAQAIIIGFIVGIQPAAESSLSVTEDGGRWSPAYHAMSGFVSVLADRSRAGSIAPSIALLLGVFACCLTVAILMFRWDTVRVDVTSERQ